MPRISILREIEIEDTPRVVQTRGIFDIKKTTHSTRRWEFDLEIPESWTIGMIVGPSGSGKSTLARELWGDAHENPHEWDRETAIVEGFPREHGISDILSTLSSVGFSSPLAWLKPYHVLSTGEKFRCDVARAIMGAEDLCVVDEFTSVVDRNVAQICSAAVGKFVRRRGSRFVAVSCHNDIADWLCPDWIVEMPSGRITLARGGLCRPEIQLQVVRCSRDLWPIFREHHYLDSELSTMATCFCAIYKKRVVAFSAWLHFPHPVEKKFKRAHRTVTLPDFQGVGIGNALSETIASMYFGLGYRPISTTTHPAMIRSRRNSDNWRVSCGANFRARPNHVTKTATNRRVTSFEYVGPKMSFVDALRLNGKK